MPIHPIEGLLLIHGEERDRGVGLGGKSNHVPKKGHVLPNKSAWYATRLIRMHDGVNNL